MNLCFRSSDKAHSGNKFVPFSVSGRCCCDFLHLHNNRTNKTKQTVYFSWWTLNIMWHLALWIRCAALLLYKMWILCTKLLLLVHWTSLLWHFESIVCQLVCFACIFVKWMQIVCMCVGWSKKFSKKLNSTKYKECAHELYGTITEIICYLS